MVEIGVYSTVGTSWPVCCGLAEFSAGKYGKGVVEVCGNGCGMDEKRRERCSEDGGVLRY